MILKVRHIKIIGITFALTSFLHVGSQSCTSDGQQACSKDEWSGSFDFITNFLSTENGNSQHSDPFDQVSGGPDVDANLFQVISSLFEQKEGQETTGNENLVTNLLTTFTSPRQEKSLEEVFGIFREGLDTITTQLRNSFGDIADELKNRLNLFQVFYFLQHEESTKNSVWKRRRHRFLTRLPVQEAIQLGDGLYLSQLAYLDDCQVIFEQLEGFARNTYVLRNCTTESSPNEPAHFLAVQRASRSRGTLETLAQRVTRAIGQGDDLFAPETLEVVLAVRGTKDLGDILSDAMLESSDYRQGKAHDGILKSALWMVELYKDDLKALLDSVGMSRMNLWTLGHSLGAGTAALVAIELESLEEEWLTVNSLGFGTPSLVSRDLSERYKHIVTTVINDADIIPRMSGASLKNAWLRLMVHNWTDAALDDFDQVVSSMEESLQKSPFGSDWFVNIAADVRVWLETWFSDNVAPILKSLPQRAPEQSELIPPGDCIHVYRDGTSWQGTYMNCTFFQELEVVRSLVDDHLIAQGYYNGLLNFIREQTGNVSWRFMHDLLDIPVA